MSQIRCIRVDPAAPGLLRLGEASSPQPGRAEALVRVHAFSLNLGEIRRSRAAAVGWRPGWDLAGVVEQAAADGSGPGAGARVVGLLDSGAWAEVVAAPTNTLAELPDTVSFAQAATLPVAGLTALYSLELGGLLLGTKVLVTGASGGVGHFACQLATLAGAHVVGAVHRPERAALAHDAGAHEVISGDALEGAQAFGPYPLILESVGGASLTASLRLLAQDGICVLYGVSAGGEVTFDARQFYSGSPGSRLYAFYLFHEFNRAPASAGLARLAALVAAGRLRPHIDAEAPWGEIGRVADQLWTRGITGKAVLHIAD